MLKIALQALCLMDLVKNQLLIRSLGKVLREISASVEWPIRLVIVSLSHLIKRKLAPTWAGSNGG